MATINGKVPRVSAPALKRSTKESAGAGSGLCSGWASSGTLCVQAYKTLSMSPSEMKARFGTLPFPRDQAFEHHAAHLHGQRDRIARRNAMQSSTQEQVG